MKFNNTTSFIPAMRAVLLGLCLTAPGVAAAFDLQAVTEAAQGGDPAAQRTLGKAMLYGTGGADRDAEAGMQLLQEAAEAGDAEAQVTLGEYKLYGILTEADPQEGARLLGAAVKAGNLSAHRKLAAALLWGSGVEADPERARQLLSAAAEAGDSDAQTTLGEHLIAGWVLKPDPAAGLRLLEQAVAAGNDTAKLKLGKLLLNGTNIDRDTDRALALFQELADAGDGEGLEVYGAQLMWSNSDPAAAEKHLRRAGELGRGSAWTTLAKGLIYGYLGKRTPSRFEEFADRAREAGEEEIALVDSARYTWGLTTRASGKKALAVLEEAAEDGNGAAARKLIALTRDGNSYNIRKSPDRAETYLERYAGLLPEPDVERFRFTIDAATARGVGEFARLAEAYENRPEMQSVAFGKELFQSNPNFAVYLFQRWMAERGLYRGSVNGYATEKTMRALVRECVKLGTLPKCQDGPLRADVVSALLAM